MRTRRAARTQRGRAPSPRPVFRRASLAVWAIAGALTSGVGAESLDEPSGSWRPAFSVGFGVQNQGFETSFDSGALDDDPPGLGVSGSDSASVLASLFRLDAALYTPTIFTGAGVPRLFVEVGAQIPLSEDLAILRLNEEFDRTTPAAILNQFCPAGEEVSVEDGNDNREFVGGCDHAGTTDVSSDASWYAGLGVEFTLPVSRRQFKLRPSIGYFGQSLRFDAGAKRVDRAEFGGDFQEGTILRELTVPASTDEIVHALGPRLTLDVEAARVGAFSLNVFLETQFYWILSERDIFFSGQGADDTADFHVKLRPLIAQGGGGLRIVWRGGN